MERREAQGPSHGPARPGTPTALKALGPGSSARRPADRNAGPREVSQTSRRLPALHSPRLRGEGKQGPRARPGTRNQTHGTAKRWLKRSLAEMPLLNATKAVSCAGLTRASMRRRNRSQLYVRLPALNQGHGLPGHGAEPVIGPRLARTRWRRPGNDSGESRADGAGAASCPKRPAINQPVTINPANSAGEYRHP